MVEKNSSYGAERLSRTCSSFRKLTNNTGTPANASDFEFRNIKGCTPGIMTGWK